MLAGAFPASTPLTAQLYLFTWPQLRLGRSHVASRWQYRVSIVALLEPLPILTVNPSLCLRAGDARCVLRTSLGELYFFVRV